MENLFNHLICSQSIEEGKALVKRLRLTVLVEDSVSMDKPDLIAYYGE